MQQPSSLSIIKDWISLLNAGNLEALLALYADDCDILPTFSPRSLTNAEDRRAYFVQLAARPALRASLHENTLRIHELGEGKELVSGIYRFEFKIDREPLVFEARFSLVIDRASPSPILHHHSSQLPRTLT
jgi:hypothetical protein